ncbi:MAG: ABC transporter ATP-binding protein/permease [Pseudorhodoplanes sp.]
MNGISRLIRDVWTLSLPYFNGEDRWAGRGLLAAVIAIELSVVAINVLINQWNARFFNSLQDKNWETFFWELQVFCMLAAAYVLLVVYQLYLNQWLQIRWRVWMTRFYVERWLHNSTHYRMQLTGDPADNPDQRIADDINQFVEKTLTIGIRLLSSVVTLISFVAILWSLSAAAPLTLFGTTVSIPGYLVWTALVYSIVGTLFAHWIGWPLVDLNFRQQRFEADFRFNLVRVRENSEQIGLLRGEAAENARLGERFSKVAENFKRLISRQKRLTFFTQSHSQIAIILPYVVVSPAYFSGAMQLGGLTQTASAFGSVQEALSILVTIYRSMAEWAAVVERLGGFRRSLDDAQVAAAASEIAITPGSEPAFRLSDLSINKPDGTPLLSSVAAQFHPGDRLLLTGPSGAGKSTLFRALAGLWPFGRGRVSLPPDARVMLLPQRPYFPVTTLAHALSYPSEAGSFDEAALSEALTAVELPGLISRLNEEGHWNRTLSLGEQQRLGIARALLQKPDFLFLDEATASLDEPAEARLYGLLHARLKAATIVSIGHRGTLTQLHDRHLGLEPSANGFRLEERPRQPAK